MGGGGKRGGGGGKGGRLQQEDGEEGRRGEIVPFEFPARADWKNAAI